MTIGLFSETSGLTLGVCPAAQPFRVGEGDPDIRLRVSWAELSAEPRGALVFDSGATWKLYHLDGGFLFRFFSSNLGAVPYREVSVAPDFATGEISLHRPFFRAGEPVDALHYPLDELLLVHFLSAGRGVEVHACGVADGPGRGYLFNGQSGDGKSTLARLWREREGTRILSDDRIVLRRSEGRVFMYGTPWHGDAGLAEACGVPLTAILFLERGAENRLIPVSAADAVARLFARSFVPFHSEKLVGATLGFLGEVAREVPCVRYPFVPGEGAVDLVAGARWRNG